MKRVRLSDKIQCENCKHVMEVDVRIGLKKQRSHRAPLSEPSHPREEETLGEEKKVFTCFPLEIDVSHRGFWITTDGKHLALDDASCRTRNSVLLDSTCLLYVWKLALRHFLITQEWIDERDLDAQNLVPHIKIRPDANAGSAGYQDIKQTFRLNESNFSAKKDFLTIELDQKRDWHFTLIYSKGLGRKHDLLEAFRQVMKVLHSNEQLIPQYSALPYFGKDAALYWSQSKSLYPHNVVPPTDFVASGPIPLKKSKHVSPSGIILIE